MPNLQVVKGIVQPRNICIQTFGYERFLYLLVPGKNVHRDTE